MPDISMNEQTRFDMNTPPTRPKWYLRLLIWLLSFPAVIVQPTKIKKYQINGLKPPYLLLCNHNAFHDFKVASVATFPYRSNNVVAIDGFIGREKLLRNVGCICKRKFTRDIVLIRHLLQVVQNGDIIVLYPEARFSLCGTTAVLPASLPKLVKLLKIPVVTLICHGNHVNSPFWNLKKRHVPTQAEMRLLLKHDEISSKSVDEIRQLIDQAFQYDDFRWQKEHVIRVTYKKRAEGLHKVLYQCAVCQTEYRMNTKDDRLFCEHCGSEWKMTELGELVAIGEKCKNIFSHIPDWYEWERVNVRNEVLSANYRFDAEVQVHALPNAEGFLDLGTGHLVHDLDGFVLTYYDAGGEHELCIRGETSYSCHIEYEYLGKYGDCIDLNTLTDTFYLYPMSERFSVTKIALATEEIYRYYHNAAGPGVNRIKD